MLANFLVAEPRSTYTLNSPLNKWVEVLVDCPRTQGLYTYAIPEDMSLQPGDIVSVPFGSQIMGGIAIRFLGVTTEQI